MMRKFAVGLAILLALLLTMPTIAARKPRKPVPTKPLPRPKGPEPDDPFEAMFGPHPASATPTAPGKSGAPVVAGKPGQPVAMGKPGLVKPAVKAVPQLLPAKPLKDNGGKVCLTGHILQVDPVKNQFLLSADQYWETKTNVVKDLKPPLQKLVQIGSKTELQIVHPNKPGFTQGGIYDLLPNMQVQSFSPTYITVQGQPQKANVVIVQTK